MLDKLADTLEEHTDAGVFLSLARTAPPIPDISEDDAPVTVPAERPRIGYVQDRAMWFYYEENLEALRDAGADLVRLDLFDDAPWPQIDGLYLGGGYPELFADAISASSHLADIRALSLANRPIYAECGGFMLLCRSLLLDDGEHPMAGLLPRSPASTAARRASATSRPASLRRTPFTRWAECGADTNSITPAANGPITGVRPAASPCPRARACTKNTARTATVCSFAAPSPAGRTFSPPPSPTGQKTLLRNAGSRGDERGKEETLLKKGFPPSPAPPHPLSENFYRGDGEFCQSGRKRR